MITPSNPDTAGDWYATDLPRMEAARTALMVCAECGAGPHGRCQLEGDGECPEGCITPEGW